MTAIDLTHTKLVYVHVELYGLLNSFGFVWV
jgi:hypothetical protein